MVERNFRCGAAALSVAVLLTSCGLKRHKYDNPITKDTQQPDKVLFDRAIGDIEHSRFERARLELQTLMNTYDTSEYMAKAKLAMADSWYREGGAHGFAQAEADYKDFILFYPNMEESAEAQNKICKMQYQQMEKSDRDPAHALRAEDECRTLLTQFPNSKFAPETQQMLRNIQEVLADKEFKVGAFYHKKGSMSAAANRLQGVVDQFPLYSGAGEALWDLADSYHRMGDRFENQEAVQYSRLLTYYPLSAHAKEAKDKLTEMKRPIPEADPVAMAHMKYEQENRTHRALIPKLWGPFASHPDTTPAAKSGTPQMTGFRPTIPALVPGAPQPQAGVTDVNATVVNDPNVINTQPDARLSQQNQSPFANMPAPAPAPAPAPTTTVTAAPPAPAPTPAPAAPAQPAWVTRDGIDLNTAPEPVMTKLVGKSLAKRVMAFRPYTSVQDLIKAGVPQKTINRMKPVPPASDSAKKSGTK
jgi:outer membrane protein assembly factor BamD